MMNRFSFLCSVIGVIGALTACGAADKRRHVLPVEAGADSGSGGASTGGASGTGGVASGGTSSGGATASGGKTSVPDASTDASTVPDASKPTADAGGQYVCPSLPSDAGDAKISQWRDYSAGVCRACPARPVGCQELLGDSGSNYDPATRVLTLHVKPGYAEVLSSTAQWQYWYPQSDGGNGIGSATVVGLGHGDEVIFDFSKQMPPGTYTITNSGFSTVDACGYTTPDTADYMEVDVTPNPDGGAPLVNIVCWVS